MIMAKKTLLASFKEKFGNNINRFGNACRWLREYPAGRGLIEALYLIGEDHYKIIADDNGYIHEVATY